MKQIKQMSLNKGIFVIYLHDYKEKEIGKKIEYISSNNSSFMI